MKIIIVTGFCFGHLIHSGLMLGYQIVYLRAEGQEFYDCASIATLLLDILYPVYSFLQLFFIFKYSNVSARTGPAILQNAQILNPLNSELNPICYLLALLAHHFLHVSSIRVKLLTFRRLMSYIYEAPILDVSTSHTTTQHSR